MSDRTPPHNPDAEAALISNALASPNACDHAITIVTPDDFYLPIAPPRGDDRVHQTQKPVELMQALMTLDVGGAALDPFMGSGTTLRAAKNLGRKAIGIEKVERYCELAAKRMCQEVLPL